MRASIRRNNSSQKSIQQLLLDILCKHSVLTELSRKGQSSCPAEVRKWKFSPFFSAKGVVKFGMKFWWNFRCYVFQGLGVRGKIAPKFHVKKGVKNGKFHANFTLLGRSAEKRLLQKSEGNFSEQSPRWILQGIFWWILQAYVLGKTGKKNPPKNPPAKIHTARIWPWKIGVSMSSIIYGADRISLR